MSQEVAEVMPEHMTAETATETTAVVIGENHPLLRHMVKSIAIEIDDMPTDDAFVMDVMEQILAAESFDDIFAAQENGMMSGQDYVMRPFLLKEGDISYRKSRHQTFPFYAILKVVDISTQDEVTLNCGGMTFLAVLRSLQNRDYFSNQPDGRPLMLKANESPNGAYLTLVPFAGAAKPAATTRAKK